MFISDLYKGGYWPLQDHSFLKIGEPLHHRTVRMALRIQDREVTTGEFGHYNYSNKLIGDVLGAIYWENDEDKREIASWWFAGPSVVDRHGTIDTFEHRLLPINDAAWRRDDRYELLDTSIPCEHPRYPAGTYGITIAAAREDEQHELLFHTDPRLIAVNFAGDPAMASVVCDLTPKNEIDLKRYARLQSMMRVIRVREMCFKPEITDPTSSILCPLDRRIDENLNALAWQLGTTGQDNIGGFGFCYDVEGKPPPVRFVGAGRDANGRIVNNPTVIQDPKKFPPSPINMIGAAGIQASGPFAVGDRFDQHNLGKTLDNEFINSLHLQTESYWLGKGGDGPFEFEDILYTQPEPGLYLCPVHLRWDPTDAHDFVCGPREGKWKWLAENFFYFPDPDVEDDPYDDFNSTEDTGVGGIPLEETDRSTIPFREYDLVQDEHQIYTATTMQTAFPVILFRPQKQFTGVSSLRANSRPTRGDLKSVDGFSPIVGRLEAYGKQFSDGDFDYTEQPCDGRWRGGSAAGGVMFLPAELDSADSASTFSPSGRPLSTAHFVFAPGTVTAWGLPDTVSGAITGGYRIASTDTTTGEVTWSQALTNGAAPITRAEWNSNFLFIPDSTFTIRTDIDGAPLVLNLQSNGAPSDDVRITWSAFSISTWSAGIDESDGGNWKLSNSGALGISDCIIAEDGTCNIRFTAAVEIDGDLNHDGSNIGFFGTAPVAQAPAYTVTNVTTDRTYDANFSSVNEIADVLGTLIADLQAYGLLQ